MDAVLGRKVLDHVIEHREQFDMGTWGHPGEGGCGTAACLAGWTLLLSGGYRLADRERFESLDGKPLPVRQVPHTARRLLDLTDEEFSSPDPGGVYDEIDLFDDCQTEDEAIARLRALVEAAEAAGA